MKNLLMLRPLAVAAIASVMVAAGSGCGGPGTLEGDGVLEMSRSGGAPTVLLETMDLGRNGARVYRFKGAPSRDKYLFALRLLDTRDAARAEALDPTIEVVLSDGSGRALHRAAGGLADGWRRNTSVDTIQYWHVDFVRMRLRSGEEYTLSVTVRGVERSEEILVAPAFFTANRSL